MPGEARPCAARDVPAGTLWAFIEHRSQAEIDSPPAADDAGGG